MPFFCLVHITLHMNIELHRPYNMSSYHLWAHPYSNSQWRWSRKSWIRQFVGCRKSRVDFTFALPGQRTGECITLELNTANLATLEKRNWLFQCCWSPTKRNLFGFKGIWIGKISSKVSNSGNDAILTKKKKTRIRTIFRRRMMVSLIYAKKIKTFQRHERSYIV